LVGRRKPSPDLRQRFAAAEAERARWARQLHDETLHGLAQLRLSLAAVEGADPFAAQDLIQQAIVDVEREAEGLRSLIVDLRPLALDRLGIAAALEALADRVEKPKLEVRTRVELASPADRPTGRLDDERETTIYRIVQAALDNTVHHAEATRAVVEVVEDEGRAEIAVTVRDDGNGFDPATAEEGGGLSGMRERVETLGGSIEIRAEVDRGTAVRAVVPSGRGISAPATAN
jgi:signal transduction histidine kinase